MQFVVRDAATTTDELVSRFGFAAQTANADGRTVVLSQGTIVVLVTQPRGPGRARDFLAAHGDGLARIGFSCSDVRKTFARAVAHGAPALKAPRPVAGTLVAAVGGIGDTTHTLVEQSPTTPTPLLPGVGRVSLPTTTAPVGLESIDHFAICVSAGQLPLRRSTINWPGDSTRSSARRSRSAPRPWNRSWLPAAVGASPSR